MTMARMHSEMSPATKALLKVISPLTAKEERNATAAAVKHLAGELSERYQVFPAELRIEKPSRSNTAPKRAIAVLIFDYEKRYTTDVLMDTLGKMIQKTDLTGFQPAFLSKELQEARQIAEKDERVARAIRVRGAFASAFGPHSHGKPGARLVGLRYATVDRKQNVHLLGEAVVDLSEQKLVNFEDTSKEEN
jgi:Cu2+-containing amine oxidase